METASGRQEKGEGIEVLIPHLGLGGRSSCFVAIPKIWVFYSPFSFPLSAGWTGQERWATTDTYLSCLYDYFFCNWQGGVDCRNQSGRAERDWLA